PGAAGTAGSSSPPSITYAIFGTSGANDWYTSDVTINWSIQSALPYTSSGCDGKQLSAETTGTDVTCSATSSGGSSSVTLTIKIDKTPPAVTATPSRSADSNGWYNHAVLVSFGGTDGTSGIAFCSSTKTYSS